MNKNLETKVAHGFSSYDEKTGAVSFPIYQSATFRHPGLNQTTGYDYSRLQNPTREQLEKTVADLEGGKFGFAFSSGMAAISTILSLFSPGDQIIVSDDLYGGTFRLFEEVYKKYGIEFTYVDTRHVSEVECAVKSNCKAVFVETPTNPVMKVADLKAISKLCKDKGALMIVDNTFLTPYLQRPLELGADIVVHSGTKYLGGHNDALAGIIVANDDHLAESINLIQKSEGAVLAPFDSWLILRGIKTLGIRLEKQQQNAIKIANWLKTNPNVEKVIYVGLEEHEGHQLCKSQASGFGAMISFYVKDFRTVERVLEKVQIIMYAESLGGVESLITYPEVQTHASIPENIRKKIGITNTLLRLSVGIEAAEDLIADLQQALEEQI